MMTGKNSLNPIYFNPGEFRYNETTGLNMPLLTTARALQMFIIHGYEFLPPCNNLVLPYNKFIPYQNSFKVQYL